MTFEEAYTELESYGSEAIKKIYINHGAHEPVFGVKVADMKKIVKKVKKNHDLSMKLYATGNSDAMYLAGLIADEKQISRAELQQWVNEAYYYGVAEYTVPWVAAESPYGWDLGLEWIESEEETISAAGWATLAYYAGVNPDENLDVAKYSELLDRVQNDIHAAKNRTRYTMNGFVIAIGGYIAELTDKAFDIGKEIGKVSVDMGGTACKVPFAPDYIQKMVDKGRIGKKRKTARC